MKIKIQLAVLFSVFACTGYAAQATKTEADTPLPNSVQFFKELDELRSQNVILTEKLKNSELKSKLGVQSQSMPMNLVSKKDKQEKFVSIDYSARVQIITGFGKNYSAVIKLGDGSETTAKVGRYVHNLGTVKSINTDEVLVQNGHDEYSIPFFEIAAQTNNGYNSTFGSSSIPVPAIPGLR